MTVEEVAFKIREWIAPIKPGTFVECELPPIAIQMGHRKSF
jgi:hypothetical protein